MLRYTLSRVWLAVVLCAVLTCASLAVGGTTNPDPISVVKYTQDTSVNNQPPILNECNGENVVMTGTMHFEYFFATDADGDFTHYDISSTSHLTGIGQTTGVKYVANDTVHYKDTTRGQASNTTTTLKSRLVAQGPTPDMLIRQLLHIVVDKSGNIKADMVKNNVTCR